VRSKEEKFTTYGICVLLIRLFRFQLLWFCNNLYSCLRKHVLSQNMKENSKKIVRTTLGDFWDVKVEN
jgi:hypothetical protein